VYEQRHDGLGLAFLAAVDATVEPLVRWPRAGAPIDGLPEDLDVRRAAVPRFPYYVAYLVTEDRVHVVAIAHDRWRPVYWSGRVDI
jgi:toxin ParE1/3/4